MMPLFAIVYGELFRLAAAGPSCGGGSFFGLPTWYKYLQGNRDLPDAAAVPITATAPTAGTISNQCAPVINGINDFWLIGAAILEILIRLGAIIAIVFVLIGGFHYMTSQGEPDKTERARNTVLNALYGLGMCIVATAAITFIAGRFSNA